MMLIGSVAASFGTEEFPNSLDGLCLDKFIPSNDIFTSDSQLSTQRMSDIIQEKWFDLQ